MIRVSELITRAGFLSFLLIMSLIISGQAQGENASLDKKPLKVYISVDMEGIWGVVHINQCSDDSPEYQQARRWMVEDINAVIEGLFQGGVNEVVVNDSHATMRNIIASELDPRATLISGSPKPMMMMEGIDSSFQACIFVGYHAQAGSAPAILDHTIFGAVIYSIKINGIEMPELGINGAIAGYYHVPVVMLTGDTETCRQAKEILGNDLMAVPVKEAVGRFAARNFPREKVLANLKEGARKAISSLDKFKTYELKPPCQFEVNFHNSQQAEIGLLIPGVKRIAPRTLSFSAQDYAEGFKLLWALIFLASGS